jgi:hypothetical protein
MQRTSLSVLNPCTYAPNSYPPLISPDKDSFVNGGIVVLVMDSNNDRSLSTKYEVVLPSLVGFSISAIPFEVDLSCICSNLAFIAGRYTKTLKHVSYRGSVGYLLPLTGRLLDWVVAVVDTRPSRLRCKQHERAVIRQV